MQKKKKAYKLKKKVQGRHIQQKYDQWFNKFANLIDKIPFRKLLRDEISRNPLEFQILTTLFLKNDLAILEDTNLP